MPAYVAPPSILCVGSYQSVGTSRAISPCLHFSTPIGSKPGLISFGCIWISELLDRLLDCWEFGFVDQVVFDAKSAAFCQTLYRLHGRSLTPEMRKAADKARLAGKLWEEPFGARFAEIQRLVACGVAKQSKIKKPWGNAGLFLLHYSIIGLTIGRLPRLLANIL